MHLISQGLTYFYTPRRLQEGGKMWERLVKLHQGIQEVTSVHNHVEAPAPASSPYVVIFSFYWQQ